MVTHTEINCNFSSINKLFKSELKLVNQQNFKVAMLEIIESTIDSEGFKGGTRGAPIMPRDAVSRTANVERTVRH